jgi:hypothetical protein
MCRRIVFSRVSAAVVGASLALARVALAWSVHVTCTDGASTAVVRSGDHRGQFAGVCDLDGTADGVCTFYSDFILLRCRIFPQAGCHDIFEVSAPPPCPFSSTPIAVALGPNDRVTRKISVFRPRNARLPRERTVLRCVRNQQATPSTTTTLPGVPSMAGDWAFDVRTLTSDCPGGVSAVVGTPMLIEQRARRFTRAVWGTWTIRVPRARVGSHSIRGDTPLARPPARATTSSRRSPERSRPARST